MKALAYYLFVSLNWVITLLPLRVLYIFSYLLYIYLAWIPGYRKQVIMKNLRNSFPKKSEKELKRIRSRFYMHLADMVMESFKLRHMSRDELIKRYQVRNPGILDRLYEEGRSSITVYGHYANWEWSAILPQYSDYRFLAVYKPLKNKYFNSFLYKIRARMGMTLVAMHDTLRTFIRYRDNGIATSTILIGDQTPARKDIKYWTRFLNQDTAVYLGIEKMARKYDLPVLYFRIDKLRRGYYTVDIEVLTEDPNSLKEYELTDMHLKMLEKQIVEKPELWLWSHKRWKHKKKQVND
jgi:Kdo2-lipid IVA lauroyltransferase/acyltransferase